MIELLSQLETIARLGQDGLLAGMAVFFRVGAMVALAPVLGEQVVPVRLRLAVALALTLILAPALAGRLPDIHDGLAVLSVLLSETAIGLALGLMLRLFVFALQIAASQIAQAASLSQMIGGIGPEPQPAIGQLLTFAGLALAAKAGLVAHVTALLLHSYDVLPCGQLPIAGEMAQWGLARTAEAFRLGFSLAAPLVVGSLLYNLTLGLVNRAMPQLSVTFIGAPALALGMLLLLALGLPALLGAWSQAVAAFLANPFAVPG